MELNHPRLECIGHVAIFYVPVQKLERTTPGGMKVKDEIHDFLLGNFNALTLEERSAKGFWRESGGEKTTH